MERDEVQEGRRWRSSHQWTKRNCKATSAFTTESCRYGKLSKGRDGYDAIRSLLNLKEGKFEYLDYSDVDVPEFNRGWRRLTQLINKLPTLPQTLEELMGANTLNRMRAALEAGQAPSEEAMIDKETLLQLQSWETRTMRLRAAFFLGAVFVAISGIAGLLYYFQR